MKKALIATAVTGAVAVGVSLAAPAGTAVAGDGDTWRTVAQVTGNTQEHIVTTFSAEQTDAVRVFVHRAGNNYSRLIELEVYGPQ